MSNTPKVKILNAAGGPGWTSCKRAKKDVSRGRARWIGAAIQYITDGDARHLAVVASIPTSVSYDRAAHSGFAGLKALRGLPMVGDLRRMLTLTTKRAAA